MTLPSPALIDGVDTVQGANVLARQIADTRAGLFTQIGNQIIQDGVLSVQNNNLGNVILNPTVALGLGYIDCPYIAKVGHVGPISSTYYIGADLRALAPFGFCIPVFPTSFTVMATQGAITNNNITGSPVALSLTGNAGYYGCYVSQNTNNQSGSSSGHTCDDATIMGYVRVKA